MSEPVKGERRGFLIATGNSKSSPSKHRLFEYRCLLCDEGTTWKRASTMLGVSCGCLKKIHASLWMKCVADAPTHEERLKLHQQRFAEKVAELNQMVDEKIGKMEQEKSVDESGIRDIPVEEAPDPLTPKSNPSREDTPPLPPTPVVQKPRKPRKPREKAAVGRKSAAEERQDESPTMVVEQPTNESPEPLPVKTTDVAEPMTSSD